MLATLVTAALLLLSVPAVSHAELLGDGGYCTNYNTLQERLQGVLGERSERARARNQEQQDTYEAARSERATRLLETRTQADGTREKAYMTLRAQATNDAQAVAVDRFVTTLEGLVDTRRAAVDEAITAFENTVAMLHEERAAEASAYVDDVETALQSAINDVRTACETGTRGSVARKQLQSAFAETRAEYKARREEYHYREQLAEARETRRAALEAARESFRAGLEDAKAELTDALGVE